MTHLGVKPFSCTICDKSFTRKERLAEHFASHESALMGHQLPFQCAYCDRRFASSKSRANHMQKHAVEGASNVLEVKMTES